MRIIRSSPPDPRHLADAAPACHHTLGARHLIAVLWALAATLAPSPSAAQHAAGGPPAATAPTAVQQELERITQRYAAFLRVAAPHDSLLQFYAEDASLHFPGNLQWEGKTAIRAFLGETSPQHWDVVEITTDSIHARADTAWQWARFRQVGGFVGGVPKEYGGGYAIRWRRHPQRGWQWHRVEVLEQRPVRTTPEVRR